MECKEKQIRLNGYNCNRIGIYPEWNVKLERYNKKIDGVYNWNISRMECKVKNVENADRATLIGIYPEWNVKKIKRYGNDTVDNT